MNGLQKLKRFFRMQNDLIFLDEVVSLLGENDVLDLLVGVPLDLEVYLRHLSKTHSVV